MITFSIRKTFLLAALPFIAGIAVCVLFKGCGHETAAPEVKVIPVKQLRKEGDTVQSYYENQIAVLQEKNIDLQNWLNTVSQSLEESKKQVQSSKLRLKSYIRVDTVITNSAHDCDSLKGEVSVFLRQDEVKDSLYDSKISGLNSLIVIKDSLFSAKSNEHIALQGLFNKSLQQQDILSNENLYLRKELRRKKVKGKLLSLGITLLSGAAAGYLMTH